MGKLRSNWTEVMQQILDEADTTDQAFDIMDKGGFIMIDSRLGAVLDDMPIGFEDLIEDDDEDDEDE